MNKKTECAKCTRVVCESDQIDKALPTCPMKTKSKLVKEVSDKYTDPKVKEFARQASIQEFECYMRLPDGITPHKPRILETVEFAKKMGLKVGDRFGI